jgi:hypothetical protein
MVMEFWHFHGANGKITAHHIVISNAIHLSDNEKWIL